MEIATELKQQKYIDNHDGMLDESPYIMKVLEQIERPLFGKRFEVYEYGMSPSWIRDEPGVSVKVIRFMYEGQMDPLSYHNN